MFHVCVKGGGGRRFVRLTTTKLFVKFNLFVEVLKIFLVFVYHGVNNREKESKTFRLKGEWRCLLTVTFPVHEYEPVHVKQVLIT